MKDNDHILTLEETEQLCRMYLDCQLSVLEEKELQYILGKISYSSPVIDEARDSMRVEGIVFKARKPVWRRPGRHIGFIAGIAAAVTILFALPVVVGTFGSDDRESVVIAYEGGKKLGDEASEKAVIESMKRAETLMAMAEAKENEDYRMKEYFENLKNNER